MNMEGLDNVDWDRLFKIDKYYLEDDNNENKRFIRDQVGPDMPQACRNELEEQARRIESMFEYS